MLCWVNRRAKVDTAGAWARQGSLEIILMYGRVRALLLVKVTDARSIRVWRGY